MCNDILVQCIMHARVMCDMCVCMCMCVLGFCRASREGQAMSQLGSKMFKVKSRCHFFKLRFAILNCMDLGAGVVVLCRSRSCLAWKHKDTCGMWQFDAIRAALVKCRNQIGSCFRLSLHTLQLTKGRLLTCSFHSSLPIYQSTSKLKCLPETHR